MVLLNIIMGAAIFGAWLAAYLKLRAKKINLGEFLLWSVLWGTLFILSEFPIVQTRLASLVGIGRGVDLIIYASIFVLFFLMFKLYTRMEAQERKMTELVREVAIHKAKKK